MNSKLSETQKQLLKQAWNNNRQSTDRLKVTGRRPSLIALHNKGIVNYPVRFFGMWFSSFTEQGKKLCSEQFGLRWDDPTNPNRITFDTPYTGDGE